MRNSFPKSIPLEDPTPCPFCGNDYIALEVDIRTIDGKIVYVQSVRCKDDHCYANIPFDCGLSANFATEKDALAFLLKTGTELWNRRR